MLTHFHNSTWVTPCGKSLFLVQASLHGPNQHPEPPGRGWVKQGRNSLAGLSNGTVKALVPCLAEHLGPAALSRHLRVWRVEWQHRARWTPQPTHSCGNEFLDHSPHACTSSTFWMQPPSPLRQRGHLSCRTPLAGGDRGWVPQRSPSSCCGNGGSLGVTGVPHKWEVPISHCPHFSLSPFLIVPISHCPHAAAISWAVIITIGFPQTGGAQHSPTEDAALRNYSSHPSLHIYYNSLDWSMQTKGKPPMERGWLVPAIPRLSSDHWRLDRSWWNKCWLLTLPILQHSSVSLEQPCPRLRYLQTVIFHKYLPWVTLCPPPFPFEMYLAGTEPAGFHCLW